MNQILLGGLIVLGVVGVVWGVLLWISSKEKKLFMQDQHQLQEIRQGLVEATKTLYMRGTSVEDVAGLWMRAVELLMRSYEVAAEKRPVMRSHALTQLVKDFSELRIAVTTLPEP